MTTHTYNGGDEKSTSRAFRVGSNLSNHQLNLDYYTHKMIHINLMVTTNQNLGLVLQKEKGIQVYH